MSTFYRETKHPVTGEWEEALWIDDLFGRHRYGVLFPSDEKKSPHLKPDAIAYVADDHVLETREPAPLHNDTTPVWDLVITDMKARDHVGRERYGTPLQAGNGRDALQDAYEEALDLCVYLRQAIEERRHA